jgi:hypothetical protein
MQTINLPRYGLVLLGLPEAMLASRDADAPDTRRVRGAVASRTSRLLADVSAFASNAGEVQDSVALSAEGKRRELEDDLAAWMAAGKKQADWLAAEYLRIADAQRGLAAAMPREPNDVAGALLDSELRAWAREHLAGNLTLRLEVLDGRHPEIADALLRAPSPLSGLAEAQYQAMRVKRIEAAHAAELAAFDAQRELLSGFEMSLLRTTSKVGQMAGLQAPAAEERAATMLRESERTQAFFWTLFRKQMLEQLEADSGAPAQ